jgi:hypothetical protein
MKNSIIFQGNNKLARSLLCLLFIIWQVFLPMQEIFASEKSEKEKADDPKQETGTQQQKSYPFTAGDAIYISTYPDTTSFLNGVFPIDDRGNVEFPIGTSVNVLRMTQVDFSQYLINNYQNYLRSPNLIVKPYLRATVAGGFTTPGLFYVDSNISFWELIRTAGGPNHEGAAIEIHWERNGEEVIDDLTPFLQNAVSLRHMGFQSGDLIWSPSPDAVDTWDIVTQRVLPILTFITSIVFLWFTYQNTIILTTQR